MTTVSMEHDPKELKEDRAELAGTGPMNKYGYGLCLYLDDDQCKKLGLDKALPAGTIVKIEGKAIVESSTDRVGRYKDESSEVSISLQITDLGVEPEGTASNAAEVLYANS